MRVRLTPLALAAALLVTAGCDSGPKVVKIAGTATYKGEPVSNLVIEFHPEHGRPSNATTNAQGHFEMSYEPGKMGVQVGTCTVTAMAHPNGSVDEGMGGPKSKPKNPEAKKLITEKYGNVAKSPMKVDITAANDNMELKFD